MEARKVPASVYPKKEIVLRVVLGPQDDEFTEAGVKSFFWNSGVITNEFDRMGCRIEREPIEHVGDGNINTDGISVGSIQVPTNGKPIIMLSDRQSTGGYAKIGTVNFRGSCKDCTGTAGTESTFCQCKSGSGPGSLYQRAGVD